MHLYPWFSSSLPFTPVPAPISLCSCTQLNLLLDNIGPEGAKALAAGLAANASVTELNLFNNSIKDEGVTAICEALRSNKETKLASLNIGLNSIGPAGAKSVAAMAAVVASVTKILVDFNELEDAGTIILCDALRESTVSKVQELGLSANRIGPDGAKAIAALCTVCASITSVC